MKKIFRTLGIDTNEDDDIFLPEHASSRKKMQSMIQSKKEVINAIRVCFDSMEKIKLDKMIQLFSFMVRSNHQVLSEKDLKMFADHFKKNVKSQNP